MNPGAGAAPPCPGVKRTGAMVPGSRTLPGSRTPARGPRTMVRALRVQTGDSVNEINGLGSAWGGSAARARRGMALTLFRENNTVKKRIA